MPDRICPSCQKTFSHKPSFLYHINPNRKRPCQPIEEDENIIFSDFSRQKPPTPEKIPPKSRQKPPKSEKMNPNFSKFSENTAKNKVNSNINSNNLSISESKHCPYCQISFTRNDSLTRHMKDRCRVKKEQEEQKHDIYMKLIEQMEKKMEVMEKKLSVNNINNGNIIHGDISTNNTNTNTNNININLVAYGKEDISKIDTDTIVKAISQGYKSVPALVKAVHFNEKYPEYHSVYIPSIKDSRAMVYNGQQWMLKDKNEVIDNMYEDKIYLLEEKFDEFYENLSKPARTRFNKFIADNDDNTNTEVEKRIKKDLAMMLYNYKHLPQKNKQHLLTNDYIS